MKKQKRRQKKRRRAVGPPLSRKHRARRVWLNVLPDDLWLRVRRGKTIWETLLKQGFHMEGECGGYGRCGKCKIKVISSIAPPSEEERRLLTDEELKQGIRLACRVRVKKDLVIYVGESDPEMEYFQILKSGYRPLLDLDPLVSKRFLTVPPPHQSEGVSDLDRIKLAMGPEFGDLKASLHCLRALPEVLKKTDFSGSAVLHDHCLLAWQGRDRAGCYGLVFDLGTSTVVGKLVNLVDGGEVGAVSRLNSQFKYGTDLISRLQYIKERPRGLEILHNLLITDLNRITKRLMAAAEITPDDIFVAVVAGNTTMHHFLLGLNPLGIAAAPFSPIVTDGIVLRAVDVGLSLHHEAVLYVMPAKTGYIGGDLISAIIASGAQDQEKELILGLDLGTNGEIFLGNRRRMMTCSAAAGPALEGGSISRGMIAKAGAIEGVRIEDGRLSYRIISNIRPKGMCGSGLVDLVAVLLHCDIIDPEGLIRPPQEGEGDDLWARVRENSSGTYDFLVASGDESYDQKPIYLTQKDVREIQLAKGAVAAGIKTLMDEMGSGFRTLVMCTSQGHWAIT